MKVTFSSQVEKKISLKCEAETKLTNSIVAEREISLSMLHDKLTFFMPVMRAFSISVGGSE